MKNRTVAQRYRLIILIFFSFLSRACTSLQSYFNLEHFLYVCFKAHHAQGYVHMIGISFEEELNHCVNMRWLVFIITVMLERAKDTEVLQKQCGMITGEAKVRSCRYQCMFAFAQGMIEVFQHRPAVLYAVIQAHFEVKPSVCVAF